MRHLALAKLYLLTVLFLSTTYAFAAGPADSEMMKPHVNPDNINAMFQRGVRHGKVEAAFFFSDNLSAFDINTRIEKDKAVLTGYVSSELEKDLATQLALNVEGIEEVENNITVDEEKSQAFSLKKLKQQVAEVATEAKIITSIESQYSVNGHLSALGIDVNAEGNAVTLSGTVTSEPHKELAELIAANTDGVETVENELRIDPDS